MKPSLKKLLWTMALLVVMAAATRHLLFRVWRVYFVQVRQPELFRFVRHEEEKIYPDGPGGRTILREYAVYAFRFSGTKPREVLCWDLGAKAGQLCPVLFYSPEKPHSGWHKEEPRRSDCGMSYVRRLLQPDTDYEFFEWRGEDQLAGTRHYVHIQFGHGDYFVSEPLE